MQCVASHYLGWSSASCYHGARHLPFEISAWRVTCVASGSEGTGEILLRELVVVHIALHFAVTLHEVLQKYNEGRRQRTSSTCVSSGSRWLSTVGGTCFSIVLPSALAFSISSARASFFARALASRTRARTALRFCLFLMWLTSSGFEECEV